MVEDLSSPIGVDTNSSHNSINQVVIHLFCIFTRNVEFSSWIPHDENEAGLGLHKIMLAIVNNVNFV